RRGPCLPSPRSTIAGSRPSPLCPARAARAASRRTHERSAAASRAPREGSGPSGFLRALESLSERLGYPGRTATLSIEHHLDRRSVDAMRPIGAVDRVLEGPRRVANITDTDFDVVFIVEAKGRVITQARLADGEVEALRDQIALIHDAEPPQKSDPANLREHQVIRVVDHRLH